MSGDRTFVMVNGPSLFGENFRDLFGKCKCVASNQTLSPSLNGVNLLRRWRCMCAQASSWAAKTSRRVEVSLASRSVSDGIAVGSTVMGMAVGVYPNWAMNGVILIAEWTCELCANSRSGSESVHLWGEFAQ